MFFVSAQSFPGPPYYQGAVFSDGPVWVTVASELLGIDLDDWAVAGATSGAVPREPTVLTPPFANLTQNVSYTVPSSLEQARVHRHWLGAGPSVVSGAPGLV